MKLFQHNDCTIRCKVCHKNTACKDMHDTSFTEGRGCLVMCEECWSRLTIEERMPYYMAICNRWDLEYHDPHKRELVRQAVLDGK